MARITFKYRPPSGIVPSGPRDIAAERAQEREEGHLGSDRKADRWWYESSHDLQSGLDISEHDTVPGELLDELFKPLRRRR
jgi:hypothetical protein